MCFFDIAIFPHEVLYEGLHKNAFKPHRKIWESDNFIFPALSILLKNY